MNWNVYYFKHKFRGTIVFCQLFCKFPDFYYHFILTLHIMEIILVNYKYSMPINFQGICREKNVNPQVGCLYSQAFAHGFIRIY